VQRDLDTTPTLAAHKRRCERLRRGKRGAASAAGFSTLRQITLSSVLLSK
jgi:hypothetical protein